ncbi:MAG: Outer membrane protein A [Legionellaceae bacterium]
MLKRKLLVSAILATLSSAALAAAPGFYVGGQLGWSKADYSASDLSAPYSVGDVKNSGLGGRISAGYQFNQNWAAELGYTKYKNVDFNNVSNDGQVIGDLKLKHQAIDLVAKGILPLDNGFNVFAKAGVAYVKQTFDLKNPQPSLSDDEKKWRPTYGLGAGYDFNQNVSTDISWMRIQNGSSINNLDLISAGVSYHFKNPAHCGVFLYVEFSNNSIR